MSNMFGTLNTGYSGLTTNQSAINVTSHNISNASNEDYTRQRAEITSKNALHIIPGDVGTGAKIQTIIRIKDDFMFKRYEDASSKLEYNSTKQDYMKEISTYFPDVQDSGFNQYLQDYNDAWNNFANNPNDGSAKVDLASKTKILSQNLQETRTNIKNLSKSINGEVKIDIDEVNRLSKNIAELNGEIRKSEANNTNHANDLRDKRDKYEKNLINLVSPTVSKSGMEAVTGENDTRADYDESYSISLGGYPLVDNSTYHPLVVKGDENSKDNFYSVYFKKQDGSLEEITDSITKGKVGSLLSLRGTKFDDNTKEVVDGAFTGYIKELDSLASGIIQSTNSIYSYSAQENASSDVVSDPVSLDLNEQDRALSKITRLKAPVRDGKLSLNIYDREGNFNKQVKVDISKDDSLKDVRDNINNQLGTDGEAFIENGILKFKGKDEGAVLVEDDGARLFDALNESQYRGIDKLNSEELKDLPIKNGDFDVVVYDDEGNEKARRTIHVDSKSKDPKLSTLSGILAQINMPNVDDNNDNDSSNDVDDYYKADMVAGKFVLDRKDNSQTTYVGLDNDSSNFGGSVGINKFFDGKNASDISLNYRLEEDSSNIHAYKAPSEGNNDVANSIVQLQYDDIIFHNSNGSEVKTTMGGFYRYVTSDIATQTQKAEDDYDNAKTLHKTIEQEYQNVSGVDTDEEMVNLMKFQRGYQASAKVITTINQMLDTLMGLKQ